MESEMDIIVWKPVKYKRSAGFRSNSLSAHHKVS